MKHRFKIPSLGITDKQLAALPFGRQLEHLRAIAEWKKGAKSVYISQKRRSTAAAIKEFRSLYSPSEWYFEDSAKDGYRDDSFQVFYK